MKCSPDRRIIAPCRSSSIHGRGATRNATPTRFNLKERVSDGDWLDSVESLDGIAPRRTTVTIEQPKSILTRNSSPDIGFDRSINPYRGCEHGCIYCFARPTHAFHDLSPGVDFESRLFAKPDAAKLLHAALSRPGYEVAPIALGTNTDPYQPIEEHWRITRSILELLLETRHPFTITTKSDRVVRDLDIIAPAARLGIGVGRAFGDLARPEDPQDAGTARPRPAQAAGGDQGAARGRRSRLSSRSRRSFRRSPTMSWRRSSPLRPKPERAARFCLPVRLPLEVAPLFRAWLDEHYPDRAAKVMATIQSIRGGRDNDPNFFTRMRGQGPWADLLRTRFEMACKRHNMPSAKFTLRTRPVRAAARRPIAAVLIASSSDLMAIFDERR